MVVLKIASSEEFKEKIATGPSIVDFYATWCGPCKMLAPKLEKLAEDTKNVVFLKVDVDECEDLAQTYEVTAMPTIIGFKDGTYVNRVVGANEDQIKELLKKLTE
uniref:Thioredoxin n=1 Tax=Schistocephalus solidus TaxID=70667 RepID=A0A0X3NKR4_SCHSO